MKKVLMAVLASAACVAMAPAAQAADIITDTLVPVVGGFDTFGATVDSGAFDLDFGFTLSSAATVSLNALTLGGAKFSVASALDGTSIFINQGLVSATGVTLGAGSYILKIAGSSTGAGSFAGNFSVTAIPEPATWAMMLVGVAAIGTAMRRRTQSVRVSFS